jgi:hypothetical protein
MGRTACTESQCLYKGALYLYLYLLFNVSTANRRAKLEFVEIFYLGLELTSDYIV